METDFLKHKHFSKLMGEGSDLDESDDDDDLLDIMSENQNMNDSGIADQPIKLDTSLMSESMIKLVRTIEERIDQEKQGPQTKVQNCTLFSSVKESEEPPITYYGDFDGDPSVQVNEYKLINDIEQGLNYLYDKGDAGIVFEDDILAANVHISDQFTLNKNPNDVFHLASPMNNNEQPSRLDSKIVKHHLYDSSKLSELKTKRKSPGIGREIKKRLGEKVEEVSTKLFQCRECKWKFSTNAKLHQHLHAYAHKRKLEINIQVEEKRLPSRSREQFSPHDRPAKLKKFSSEKRDFSPEKKVICQHCQEKFFSLENLLYHLRAEHKNRKKCIKESTNRTKYIYSKEKRDSLLPEETEENMELSGSESNEDVTPKTFACSLCSKKYSNSSELDNHLRLSHRDAFISDRHKFVCDLCRKTFLTKYDLIQHTEDKHYIGKTTSPFKVGESPSPKKYECKFCHVTFLKFQSLKYHLSLAHKL